MPPQYQQVTPRGAAFSNEFPIPRGFAPSRGIPGTTPEYMNHFDSNYTIPVRAHRHNRKSDATPFEHYCCEEMRHASESTLGIHPNIVHGANYYGYNDTYDESLPLLYDRYHRHANHEEADGYHYDQAPIHNKPKSASRPRCAPGTSQAHPTSSKKTAAAAKFINKATKKDARNAGIPAGYCYKYWDPSEEPIILSGSVFDAHSLGKWVYDWTVFYNGPASPLAEIAGELWLLLIQLAGKMKQAGETMPKVCGESQEVLEGFLESGERLKMRFAKLLKVCETYMHKNASKNSSREFVDTIFGRDRELEHIEKLMTDIRHWNMLFDANHNDIVYDSTA
jgi:hypothetical protein